MQTTQTTIITDRNERRETESRRLFEAHERARRNAENRPRRRTQRKAGSVRLSNRDSIGRAQRIRTRLHAKLGEVLRSGLERNQKLALARTVQLQIDNVERVMTQIRRRERAETDEKRERRQEATRENRIRQEETRRRRRSAMRERSIRVRRDFLYAARRGGFDPAQANQHLETHPAVTYDVGGKAGTITNIAAVAAPAAVDVKI